MAAIDAGIGSLMTAYMDLNDVPAGSNKWLLTDVFRNDLQFKGFITSDSYAISKLVDHGYADTPLDAAYKAISSGAGIDMASRTYETQLSQLMAQNSIDEAQLDAAVLPLLAVKYQIGLFEHPFVDEPVGKPQLEKDGRDLSRRLATRSMVLLKNNGALPLSLKLKRVLVIGSLADSAIDTQGGRSPRAAFTKGHDEYAVTILNALRERALPGAKVSYLAGPSLPRLFPSPFQIATGKPAVAPATAGKTADWVAQVKAAAASADVVIAVLGEEDSMSGEGSSRATLSLPGIQEEMLEAAVSTGQPVVVVLMNGRPLDISWAAEHASAILEAWLPAARVATQLLMFCSAT